MSLPPKNKYDPSFTIVDSSGNPTQFFRDYMVKIDALVAAMAAGTLPNVNLALLKNAANDAAAARLGVPVSGVYRNGSALMVRVV